MKRPHIRIFLALNAKTEHRIYLHLEFPLGEDHSLKRITGSVHPWWALESF